MLLSLTLDTVSNPLRLLSAAPGQGPILDDDNLRGQVTGVGLRALRAHAVLPHQLGVRVRVRAAEELPVRLCVGVGEGAGGGGRRRVSTCFRLKSNQVLMQFIIFLTAFCLGSSIIAMFDLGQQR